MTTLTGEIDFEAALAHQLRSPVSALKASSHNLRRNLRGLLEDLSRVGGPTGAHRAADFLARVVDEPAPPPLTGLLPRDRLGAIVQHLHAAGIEGEVASVAASLLRGGWDTYIEEIAPLLNADPGASLSLLETAARIRASLAAIETSLARIEGLSAALRALTCPLEAPPADLASSLEDAAALVRPGLAAAGQIRVRIEAPPPVAAPEGLLRELWGALLANAAEATGGRGTIRVEARAGHDDGALVEVIDDGPGIDAGVIERVFDAGFTTRAAEGGSGLGLALARRIAERLSGSVAVESRPGRTCFSVRLPAARQSARMASR